jgi:UDP-3-O-[3-hydroxymyristoyl] N-acetylglucosamine deacetylase/3-hydroxyacyl-[acyl-carrier-protein] dehydratase
VIHIDENTVAGVKNVTFNENFFQGHFPGNPGNAWRINCRSDGANRWNFCFEYRPGSTKLLDIFFERLKIASLEDPVMPGDTMIIDAIYWNLSREVLQNERKGFCR